MGDLAAWGNNLGDKSRWEVSAGPAHATSTKTDSWRRHDMPELWPRIWDQERNSKYAPFGGWDMSSVISKSIYII